MFLWTDERVQALKEMIAEGMSASKIAAVFGDVTRNSVIGKTHRLRLATGARAPKGRPLVSKAQRKAIARSNASKAPQICKTLAAGRKINWRDSIPFSDPPVPAVARVSFDELESHHCKYPVGTVGEPGFGFCGEPRVMGKVYCESCCRVAYPSPAPRKPAPSYVVVPNFALADA